ncbi:MAG: hypothetical protein ABSA12_12930 [Verrucomicrobiia bacterium]
MNGQWQAVCHSSGTTLVGVLAAGVLYLGPVPRTFAQAGQPNRLVEYVSPTRLSPDAAPNSPTQTNVGDSASITAPSWGDILKPGTKTSSDRLVSFEQQYGMGEGSGSTLGRVLQAAKYGLDKTCFTVQEAAKKLEFKYDTSEATSGVLGGDAGEPQYSLPVFGRFSHAQLQTEVTVHDPQTGQAFIGVKLAIPFGPGGEETFETPRSDTHQRQPVS